MSSNSSSPLFITPGLARDGDGYHAGRVAADRCRDEKLRRAGYVVLRVPGSLVERRLEDAVALVRAALGG